MLGVDYLSKASDTYQFDKFVVIEGILPYRRQRDHFGDRIDCLTVVVSMSRYAGLTFDVIINFVFYFTILFRLIEHS
jgi:hypothetical protein